MIIYQTRHLISTNRGIELITTTLILTCIFQFYVKGPSRFIWVKVVRATSCVFSLKKKQWLHCKLKSRLSIHHLWLTGRMSFPIFHHSLWRLLLLQYYISKRFCFQTWRSCVRIFIRSYVAHFACIPCGDADDDYNIMVLLSFLLNGAFFICFLGKLHKHIEFIACFILGLRLLILSKSHMKIRKLFHIEVFFHLHFSFLLF